MSLDRMHAHVFGRPAPQGSKTVRAGRALDANPNARPWRQQVAAACEEALQERLRPAFTGAVRVEADFRFKRPASARGVRAVYPVGRGMGDLDKLVRGVLDGLVLAGVIRDDSQVVELAATKVLVSENRT